MRKIADDVNGANKPNGPDNAARGDGRFAMPPPLCHTAMLAKARMLKQKKAARFFATPLFLLFLRMLFMLFFELYFRLFFVLSFMLFYAFL